MKWIFERLKQAREGLSLSQKDAAEESGVSQKDISLLENGKREFIPNRYILFLSNRGIDLNSIFNEKREVAFVHPIDGNEEEKIAPKTAPNIAPNEENGPLSKSAQEQLQEYDSRLKSLENNMKDILKRLPK